MIDNQEIEINIFKTPDFYCLGKKYFETADGLMEAKDSYKKFMDELSTKASQQKEAKQLEDMIKNDQVALVIFDKNKYADIFKVGAYGLFETSEKDEEGKKTRLIILLPNNHYKNQVPSQEMGEMANNIISLAKDVELDIFSFVNIIELETIGNKVHYLSEPASPTSISKITKPT